MEHGIIRRASHRGLDSDSPAARELIAALEAQPFSPPPPSDLALARALVRDGAVVELDGVYFARSALDRARALIVDHLREHGSLTVADARDLLESTRKYVLPIVSQLDATGVTRRRGDLRIPGPTSGLGEPGDP